MKFKKSDKFYNQFRPAILIEELEETIQTVDSLTKFDNQDKADFISQDINKDLLISQAIRLCSLLSKAVDLSVLPQDEQDAITASVKLFEKYPMMGDQMMLADGAMRLNGTMVIQDAFARNYATNSDTVYDMDPYAGIKRTATSSILDQGERQSLIDELVSQSLIDFTAFEQNDQDAMTTFIDENIIGNLTGVYAAMPSGRDLYDSLSEATGQEINVMINKHMAAGTIFDADTQLFRMK